MEILRKRLEHTLQRNKIFHNSCLYILRINESLNNDMNNKSKNMTFCVNEGEWIIQEYDIFLHDAQNICR